MEQPGIVEPRFQTGALVIHCGAIVALGEDHFDLTLQLVADHLRHAEPYEHGWLSGTATAGSRSPSPP